MLEEYRKREKC